jgi:hypothetical protein
MIATPPEANTEYSSRPAPTGPALAAIAACGLLGTALLLVAEFVPVFDVHVTTSAAPIRSVRAGSHDSYALIPIALLAGTLTLVALRHASRPGLLALGVLGIITVMIALLRDLPDAEASGVVGSAATHYVSARSTPAVGLYLETLGAVVLVIACGVGLLLLGPQPRRAPGGRHPDTNLAEQPGSH